MSGLDQLVRLQKWSLDEKRRQATDLEALIDRLNGDLAKLDAEVAREIEAARNDLELQRALPAYRQAMVDRRERLEKSILDLANELEKLRDQITEAFAELKKTEQTIANRQQRQRTTQRRRDQIQADDLAIDMHRRKTKE